MCLSVRAAIVAIIVAIAGCAEEVALPPSNDCAAAVTADCLITLAESQLEALPEGTDWINSATELASALYASGRSTQAAEMFSAAADLAAALEDTKTRAVTLADVMSAVAGNGCATKWSAKLVDARSAAQSVEYEEKRWDLLGKLAVVEARCGEAREAAAVIDAMQQSTDNTASFKARSLRELAIVFAEKKDFDAALKTLASIDMGLSYYKAVAQSDVARLAVADNRSDMATELLIAAEKAGRAIDDGYFKAGVLRDVAGSYQLMGKHEMAAGFFADALAAAHEGQTDQHRARALSRVATDLADLALFEEAAAVFPESVRIAKREPTEMLRHWAFYEIAGSAAFGGDFETANEMLASIPASVSFSGTSLQSAARRDVAWGLSRHGRTDDALQMALSIETTRERIQALSRIARLLEDPAMHALPRYL